MYLGRLFMAFVGFLLFIFLVIFLFVGHGKKPVGPAPKPLYSYANTDATVSMATDGPINGDDSHRQIKITVSANSRELDIIQGYSGTVIQTNPQYNSQDAFNVFLHAINNAGFTVLRKGQSPSLDDTGQCALGERFIFTLQQDGNVISRLWTSSCGTSVGNFGGSAPTLQQLFQAQITKYDQLTENVNLGL